MPSRPLWLRAFSIRNDRPSRRKNNKLLLNIEQCESRIVPATAYVWNQTAGGAYNWGDAANWNSSLPGTVPGPTDDATFPDGILGAQTITLPSSDTTVHSITFQQTGTLGTS